MVIQTLMYSIYLALTVVIAQRKTQPTKQTKHKRKITNQSAATVMLKITYTSKESKIDIPSNKFPFMEMSKVTSIPKVFHFQNNIYMYKYDQ